ncbi:conserved hypothetical protein [Bradyrhizobium oligotrophicum S58]|uniref:Antibiotic biosynthesis monooxygenase n=1 Tax=Bradyrhizobium oligotrophicum S58 TaxID=1245469 RepID=M4ZEP8_9BRAD|nr:conserved hypothetical protein [Bradyrhizobium oligotrophicum S58]
MHGASAVVPGIAGKAVSISAVSYDAHRPPDLRVGRISVAVIRPGRPGSAVRRVTPPANPPYELFRDEAAFKAHQESDHFKTSIAGQALPLLARRERMQYGLI